MSAIKPFYQSVFEKATQGSVQRAGRQPDASVAQFRHAFHQGVSVLRRLGEAQQNPEHRLADRPMSDMLWRVMSHIDILDIDKGRRVKRSDGEPVVSVNAAGAASALPGPARLRAA